MANKSNTEFVLEMMAELWSYEAGKARKLREEKN